MLHAFWVDPVSPVLDAKQVGLTLVSVLLFLGSLALQIAVNNKLQTVDKVRDGVQVNSDDIAALKAMVDALKTKVESASFEAHEQWGKLNDLEQHVRENTLRMGDIKSSMESISHQQTVQATTQLGQQQQTQKVIDSLIEVLQDNHAGRD